MMISGRPADLYLWSFAVHLAVVEGRKVFVADRLAILGEILVVGLWVANTVDGHVGRSQRRAYNLKAAQAEAEHAHERDWQQRVVALELLENLEFERSAF